MRRPNILFIVWDACRLDTAEQNAPNLASLAEDNLWFENAITPAGYSLPAHASIMSGEYLHEHGIFSRTHQFGALPLLDRLSERAYTLYGVSANGFASPRYRFDEPFDSFYNTQGQMVFPEGLDVHRHARNDTEADGQFSSDDLDYTSLLRSVFTHDHPLRSLVNVSSAAVSELARRYPALQKLPHHRFSRFHEFSYSPSRNTRVIRSIIDREADGTDPFFLFTNYMDAHHPYAPPDRLQREFCDRTFSYRELSEIAEISHPWNYLRRVQNGNSLDRDTLETLRCLYAGEVRSADEHLGKILDSLKQAGMYENTLVIVTADHGENLGETDRLGETRIGHECSASDHLLRVPLVIAHPALAAATIDELVSIKDLSSLLTEGLDGLLSSNGTDYTPLKPPQGIVRSQIPPPANPTLQERYPELSDILERSLSVAYFEDWKVVVTSRDETFCWKDDEPREVDEAPEPVRDRAAADLSSLVKLSRDRRELTEAEIAHLDSLGYL